MDRYTLERCRPGHPSGRNYGYAVRDRNPLIKNTNDIEGVGLVACPPTPIIWVGWARTKTTANHIKNMYQMGYNSKA